MQFYFSFFNNNLFSINQSFMIFNLLLVSRSTTIHIFYLQRIDVSSVNEKTVSVVYNWSSSFMHKINTIGPRTDPWGTPTIILFFILLPLFLPLLPVFQLTFNYNNNWFSQTHNISFYEQQFLIDHVKCFFENPEKFKRCILNDLIQYIYILYILYTIYQ